MEESVFKYNRENLSNTKQKDKRLTKLEATNFGLTNFQIQILYGSILGDGSLKRQKNYTNVRFQMRHSEINQAWFFWKANQLGSLGTTNAVHLQRPDGYSQRNKLHFQTRALPILTKLHHECYKDNFICLRMKWLNKLTPLGLMVWWLDDGGLVGFESGKGRLATQCFSFRENLLLKRYFERKWNISPIVCKVRRTYKSESTKFVSSEQSFRRQNRKFYYFLEFSSTNFKKLSRIIMPYVPVKEMVYKFFIRHKKKHIFDRWIRQLKLSMPQFLNEIEEFENQFDEMI